MRTALFWVITQRVVIIFTDVSDNLSVPYSGFKNLDPWRPQFSSNFTEACRMYWWSNYSKYFGNAFSLSANTYTYERTSNGNKKSEIRVRMPDEFLSAVLRIATPTLIPRCGVALQYLQPTPSVALIWWALALLLCTEVGCYFLAVNRRLNYYIFLFPILQEHTQPVLRLLVKTFVHFWAILADVFRCFRQPPTNYATITIGHVPCNLLLLNRGVHKFTNNLGAIPERHKGDMKQIPDWGYTYIRRRLKKV
jgi:hypothetical protein